ncbi:hypothetical protein COL27_20675 [Bacillus sp. AFS075960]|nr:hypothetical protein COL27_20675 [Bacillus sp. AFS075960]
MEQKNMKIMEKELLEQLLCLYEGSKAWISKCEVKDNFGQTDTNVYKNLYLKKKLIQVGDPSVKEAYLNLENVYTVYRQLNRKMTEEEVDYIINYIEDYKEKINTSWIREFINNVTKDLKQKRRVPSALGNGFSLLEKILKTLKGIDNIQGESLSERVFSKKYLGDSKIFEGELRKRILTIIRKYYGKSLVADKDILDDEFLLSEVGILKAKGELLIKGDLIIKLGNDTLDYHPFINGAMIDATTINEGEIEKVDTKNIVIIENKAVFNEAIQIYNKNKKHFIKSEYLKSPLFVYIGGFPGQSKRTFLGKIDDFFKAKGIDPNVYFWGDIDYGGIQIFLHLKKNVFDNIQMLHMDTEILEKFSDHWSNFDEKYEKKLESLYDDEKESEIKNLVKYMIDNNCWLEQEALIYT